MFNQTVVIGRITEFTDPGITIQTTVEEVKHFISIKLIPTIDENVKANCKVDDVLGIKGRLETENGQIIVVAEKVTYSQGGN